MIDLSFCWNLGKLFLQNRLLNQKVINKNDQMRIAHLVIALYEGIRNVALSWYKCLLMCRLHPQNVLDILIPFV